VDQKRDKDKQDKTRQGQTRQDNTRQFLSSRLKNFSPLNYKKAFFVSQACTLVACVCPCVSSNSFGGLCCPCLSTMSFGCLCGGVLCGVWFFWYVQVGSAPAWSGLVSWHGWKVHATASVEMILPCPGASKVFSGAPPAKVKGVNQHWH
jgi:hypothetical protein